MILTILLFSILILTFGLSARKFYSTTKQVKVSRWARKNRTQARWLLVAFNLAMALTGISIGLLCVQLNLELNEYALYFGLGLFAIGTILFPSNDKSSADIAGRYKRKQLLAIVRMSGSTLAVMAFANLYFGQSGAEYLAEAGVSPVVLILLATLGLVVLGAAILLLSCGLACSGYGAIAIFVLLGGGIGLITLYVFVIRKINAKSKSDQGKRSSADIRPDILDDSLLDS